MLAPRWAKAAVIYFVLGVGIGLYMSLSRNHGYGGLHAHVNLLGWASMALIAVFYRTFTELESHKLSGVTFWIYQIFFPMMMLGLYLGRLGYGNIAAPLVGFGGMFTAAAVLLFAIVALGSIRASTVMTGAPIGAARTITR